MHTMNLRIPFFRTIIRIDAVVSSLYKLSFWSKFVQYLLCIYLILLLGLSHGVFHSTPTLSSHLSTHLPNLHLTAHSPS